MDFFTFTFDGPPNEGIINPDEEVLYNIKNVFPGAKEIYSVDQYFIYECQKVINWDVKNSLTYDEGSIFKDYQPCAIGWPLFSQKTKNLINENEIDGVQFLPINIVNRKTNEINKNYYTVNILNSVNEAVDLNKTLHHYSKDADNNDVLMIDDPRPKIIYEKVKNLNIFRIKENPFSIYISETVKKLFERHNITGIEYTKVLFS